MNNIKKLQVSMHNMDMMQICCNNDVSTWGLFNDIPDRNSLYVQNFPVIVPDQEFIVYDKILKVSYAFIEMDNSCCIILILGVSLEISVLDLFDGISLLCYLQQSMINSKSH